MEIGNKINPPINRMGGKSKLKEEIIKKIPKHKCYVEAFFGAGWVYFSKQPSNVEVINDKDSNLINLFKILKYHSQEFQRLLEYEINARDTFNYYKNVDNNELTDIQKAIKFYYLILNSFSARGSHYGYATSKKPNQKLFKEDFKDIRERLKNTYIENLDFGEIIKKYDREQTVFFCDPPYLELTGYDIKFKEDEHYRLNELLIGIKGKFILTINDHPLIKKLYHKFTINQVQTIYSVARKGNKQVTELIITNY